MAESIVFDPVEFRASRYDLKNIELFVDGRPARLINVSATGFLIDAESDAFKLGQSVRCRLVVPVREQTLPFDVAGEVARITDKGTAIHYATAAGRSWRKLLDILNQKSRAERST